MTTENVRPRAAKSSRRVPKARTLFYGILVSLVICGLGLIESHNTVCGVLLDLELNLRLSRGCVRKLSQSGKPGFLEIIDHLEKHAWASKRLRELQLATSDLLKDCDFQVALTEHFFRTGSPNSKRLLLRLLSADLEDWTPQMEASFRRILTSDLSNLDGDFFPIIGLKLLVERSGDLEDYLLFFERAGQPTDGLVLSVVNYVELRFPKTSWDASLRNDVLKRLTEVNKDYKTINRIFDNPSVGREFKKFLVENDDSELTVRCLHVLCSSVSGATLLASFAEDHANRWASICAHDRALILVFELLDFEVFQPVLGKDYYEALRNMKSVLGAELRRSVAIYQSPDGPNLTAAETDSSNLAFLDTVELIDIYEDLRTDANAEWLAYQISNVLVEKMLWERLKKETLSNRQIALLSNILELAIDYRATKDFEPLELQFEWFRLLQLCFILRLCYDSQSFQTVPRIKELQDSLLQLDELNENDGIRSDVFAEIQFETIQAFIEFHFIKLQTAVCKTDILMLLLKCELNRLARLNETQPYVTSNLKPGLSSAIDVLIESCSRDKVRIKQLVSKYSRSVVSIALTKEQLLWLGYEHQ